MRYFRNDCINPECYGDLRENILSEGVAFYNKHMWKTDLSRILQHSLKDEISTGSTSNINRKMFLHSVVFAFYISEQRDSSEQ